MSDTALELVKERSTVNASLEKRAEELGLDLNSIREELSRMEARRKYYPNAKQGMSHLVERWSQGNHEAVATKDLMAACGVYTPSAWTCTLNTMRDILGLFKHDLANTWGTGYYLAAKPEDTLREMVKSHLRSINHWLSGNKRRMRFDEQLKSLSPKASAALVRLDAISAIFTPILQGTYEQLKISYEELSEAEDQVKHPVAEWDPDEVRREAVQGFLDVLGSELTPALSGKTITDEGAGE